MLSFVTRFLAAFWVALASIGVAAATDLQPVPPAGLKTADFAGGCFWCMEHPFDELNGVVSVTSGYTGGTTKKPTYHQVSSGTTGHAEAVQVVFDPKKISYEKLLEVFWRNIDPFDAEGQFCDKGNQYRSAIFYADAAQKKLAEASKRSMEQRFGKSVATEIVSAAPFYRAEEYHQKYYRKNPLRYQFYRGGCGRDARLQAIWTNEASDSATAAMEK